MMISPENFIEECKNNTYEELISIREELIDEILYFEKHKDEDSEEIMISPSPEVVYQMNLKYLGELCKLISYKYNSDKFRENDN